MDWHFRFLNALKGSRTSWDEPADWRAALALYEGISPEEAAELDRTVLEMIDVRYRNRHSDHGPRPFDEVRVNLPLGMSPDDLLCLEAAVMVAAERGLGGALFRLNRLMGLPAWHLLNGRLNWLDREGFTVQRRLGLTRAGRGLGALLGLAAGDALGCTLEFMGRAEVRRRYPGGHREIVGGGPFGFSTGSWTDDTQMAAAVGQGILEAPQDPVDAVGTHFMSWFQGCPPDVGNTCRVALVAFQQTDSWAEATAAVEREMGEWAGGNGALMRTLPAALAYGPDLEQALRIGQMTHPHPESDAALALYHRMVDALLNGATKHQALQAALTLAASGGPALFGAGLAGSAEAFVTALRTWVDRLRNMATRPEETISSGGYVVDTLEAALWAFLITDSLEECIVTAVNLGDDADTVGAVAGGLAGAFYGPAALPRRWSLVLQGRARLEELAEGLHAVYLTRTTPI